MINRKAKRYPSVQEHRALNPCISVNRELIQ